MPRGAPATWLACVAQVYVARLPAVQRKSVAELVLHLNGPGNGPLPLKACGLLQPLSSASSPVPCQLCELAATGALSTPLAAQLLIEVTRQLSPHEWLPHLTAQVDFGQHLLSAAGRAAAAAATVSPPSSSSPSIDAAAVAGDLGLLSLALAVAQVPDGARVLYDRGVFGQLVAAGRHLLLPPPGGRLATFSVIAVTGSGPYKPGVDGTYASTTLPPAASGATWQPDTCGVYVTRAGGGREGGGYGGGGEGGDSCQGVWSPVHRQWCTQLQFSAALLRTLGQHVDVEREVRGGPRGHGILSVEIGVWHQPDVKPLYCCNFESAKQCPQACPCFHVS